MDEIRGLTVLQPWAWAIIHGHKDVENRTRSLGPYRGPVAIHAGKGWSSLGAVDASVLGAMCAADPHGAPLVEALGFVERQDDAFEFGAIIGVVDLVDAHWSGMECSRRLAPCHEYDLCSEWAHAYNHHLVLVNPRPLVTPIRWRGALSLWRVPDELGARIRDQGVL